MGITSAFQRDSLPGGNGAGPDRHHNDQLSRQKNRHNLGGKGL